MRRILVLISLGLVAAACGGESSSTFASLDAGPEATIAPSSSNTTPASEGRSGAGTPATLPPPGADIPASDYPDVVVADLAGGQVNLTELVLEEKPVLLWFWAPH